MAINDMVPFIAHRYGTADPFTIAEQLNIDVRWRDLGPGIMGKTVYVFGQPTVLLNPQVKDTPERLFVMAHELGHVILHEGLASYYRLARGGNDKAEYEADCFAEKLLVLLYVEENRELPATYDDVVHGYGFPEL
ncbi:ImmA/IrrE family metallo-endopeptidase [Lacticaseibacillus parakribbianus]|uniref:ImmA/IrrE family metallo-endopeptidase n=1 Tax=Lacticaseibacillus parakribbianus TaxID=2970927 RepID=UPI0021CB84A9|nr:ImmA/IrrE family metallo-endopeptidase [Lacticaseibacillus parakribbianus]